MPRLVPPTSASPSPTPSVYSDDASIHSYLEQDEGASPSPSIISSSLELEGATTTDSLADASEEEVAARVEFLLAPAVAEEDNEGLTAMDLPRRLPSTPEGKAQAQDSAVTFLRHKVAQAEEDDWRYTEGRGAGVFGPPEVLEYTAGGVQHPTADEWGERAFNLHSFGGELEEVQVQMEQGGGRFEDGVQGFRDEGEGYAMG